MWYTICHSGLDGERNLEKELGEELEKELAGELAHDDQRTGFGCCDLVKGF